MALPADAPAARDRWHWTRRPWLRKTAITAEILVVALAGCWIGLLAAGRTDVPVGPVQTRFSVSPSIAGDSVVSVPPLGRLSVDSHDGPWRLDVEVTRLDANEARRIFIDPSSVNGLADRVTADIQVGVRRVAYRAALAGIVGALLLGLLVFRRHPRRAAVATAVSAALVVGGGGAAAVTWRPEAINEPQYDGLLASAPTVVGDARSIVADFREYERQLAKLVTNVSRLYDVTSALPAYTADPDAIRVLFVSDIHLNPAAWDILRSITRQFDVDVIVDTGDMSDHGTLPENPFVDGIAELGVPYVYVRGNHDSLLTQRAVAAQPNATVLDNSTVEVEGLRIIGIGDPRFTPDKEIREDEPQPPTIAETGQQLAALARASRRTSQWRTTPIWQSSSTGWSPSSWPATSTAASSTSYPTARCSSSRARPGHRGCAASRRSGRRRCGAPSSTSRATRRHSRRGTTSRWAASGWRQRRSSDTSTTSRVTTKTARSRRRRRHPCRPRMRRRLRRLRARHRVH